MEILRVKGKRTRVLGVRNNGVEIILVGETTKELEATLYENVFGDICHQFIIVNYMCVKLNTTILLQMNDSTRCPAGKLPKNLPIL